MANPNIVQVGRKTQFKPGVSGNPKGRPAGVKNWSTIVRKMLADPAIARGIVGAQTFKKLTKGLEEKNLAHIIPAVMAAKVIESQDVHAASWLYKVGGFDRDEVAGSEPPEDISAEEAERIARQAIEWSEAKRKSND